MFKARVYAVVMLVAVLGVGCGGGGGVSEPPPSDTERPRIASVNATRAAGKIVVEAVVTDGGGSGVARVEVETPDSGVGGVMESVGDGRYRLVLGSETGRVRVYARDGDGNEARSEWVIAPAPDPPNFQ